MAPSRAAYIDRFIARHGVAVASATIQAVARSRTRLGVALLYHEIGGPARNPEREIVATVAPDRFREQLAFVEANFRPVLGGNLLEAVARRGPRDPIPLAITFDDDLRSHVEVAMPILLELKMPATFFVSGASAEEPFAFWWELLQAAIDRNLNLGPALAPFLGASVNGSAVRELARRIESLAPAQQSAVCDSLRTLLGEADGPWGMPIEYVTELVDAGFEVGFHTRGHHRLTSLVNNELAGALTDGRFAVERAARRHIDLVAYPHGTADVRVAAAARDAGYVGGFIGSGAAARPGIDPLLQPRVGPSPKSMGHFALSLARALLRRGDLSSPLR